MLLCAIESRRKREYTIFKVMIALGPGPYAEGGSGAGNPSTE